jgi:phage terminase large subunit GpA-like protein
MRNVDLSNPQGIRSATKAGLKYLKPPEKLLPSEFAEKHLRIPAGNAIPGPVRFRNAPHQVEPLNLIDDPDCERITLMWGAQTGKTQTALMAKAYFIGHKPKNMMAMQPSKSDLNTWLNAKFDPMVDSTPLLSERVAKPRGREGVNNQEMKTYPAGALMFAWSGSPKTMRGRSAGIIFPDETDGYERTQEGHPVSLIWQRAATFGDDKLLFETSTPTLKSTSYIEGAFESGDMRRWYVDCPDCSHTQYLKWSQVTWKKSETGEHLPDAAEYCCEECGTLWTDEQRVEALRKGRWIAEKPYIGHASFHLPEMASCFVRLKDVVRSFLTKKKMGDLQTFTNVSLAETWQEETLKRDPDVLFARREHYKSEVPEKAYLVTAAIDVQDDRLEIQWEAWGEQQENWKLRYEVIRGNLNNREIWDRLDFALDRSFKHDTGVNLNLSAATIDTGGHFTQEVYDYVKRSRHYLYAIKGSSQREANLVSNPSRNNLGGVDLYSLGVHKLKLQIMQRTGIESPGAGYVHFPVSDDFDLDYFKGYTAEELKPRRVKGRNMDEFVKVRPRNEPFDLSVYNLAALIIYNPDFNYLKSELDKKRYREEPQKQKVQQTNSWINNSNDSWI